MAFSVVPMTAKYSYCGNIWLLYRDRRYGDDRDEGDMPL